MSLSPSLLLVPVCCVVAAPAPLPSAQEVLARAKAAAGGAAWDRVTYVSSRAWLVTGKLKGELEELECVVDGRNVSRYDMGSLRGANGYDGRTGWSQDATGDVRREPVEKPATQNYWLMRAYWYPARCPAETRHLGVREQHFHVLAITPEGASKPFEVWVDGRTWLIDRVVVSERGRSEVTFFRDYREVGGVKLPFRTESPKGGPDHDARTEYRSIVVNGPLPKDAFAVPELRLTDFGIEGGGRSTTAGLEWIGDHLFVMAKVNGQGPFRFFLDTGGVNVLTPTAAKALGLVQKGSVQGGGVGEAREDFGLTRVSRVQVGGAWMRDQSFYVIPSLEGIGRMMGVEVSGVLGYELLRRFIARVEYGPKRLTLTLPEGWRYAGQGFSLPFTFNGHHPRVKGELDGIPGLFDIDTGSGSTLDVYGPFAARHGLKEKASKAISTVTGQGAGGEVKGHVIRARELKLGAASLKAPIVALSATKSGGYADESAAGNVGQGFLARFDLTFDYRAQVIHLEPNGDHDRPDRWSMTGLRCDATDVSRVLEVYPESPASEAGLKAGDRLLAIEDEDIARWSGARLRDLSQHAEPGRKVILKVQRDGKTWTAQLVLRDLL
jgi:hypothetical protein